MTVGSVKMARLALGVLGEVEKMQSSDAVTVSSPAMRNRKQMSRMSSRVRLCPSTSMFRNVVNRSSRSSPSAALVEHLVEVVVDRLRSPASGGR